PDALLHVDGVQGFLRVPMTLPQTHVSLYTLSAHKIHGPKGVGALVIRKGVRLTPRIVGGGQEQGMRSGTENMPGIVGLRTAIEAFAALPQPGMHLREMKLSFYKQLRAYIPTLCVNGPDPESTEAAPHILNVSLPGVRGEVMLHALEEKGVFVSTGSACSSKKRKHSPVLEAMRMSAEDMESAIRISLSPMNTMEEMQDAAQAFFACHEVYKHYKRR
ncbi:MAG: aminotransferase class V-fold PLP-dependent enzyme, partial [Clostridia bacterium]